MSKKQLKEALETIKEYCVRQGSCGRCPLYKEDECLLRSTLPTGYQSLISLVEIKYSRTDLQGSWVSRSGNIACSNCESVSTQRSNYCSVCGARMVEWALLDK